MEKKVIKEYVLGFAFNSNTDKVALIEKQKPEWQKGKYNGVGGKIEVFDKSRKGAMVREFKEETSVETSVHDWSLFATMIFDEDIMGGSAIVYCYKMFSDKTGFCRTTETEEIKIINMEEINDFPLIDNLHVLLPMALHTGIKHCKIEY